MATFVLRLLIASAVCFGLVVRITCADDAAPKSQNSQATADNVERWIADLDSAQYLTRERATQQLLEAKSAGLAALLEAANGELLEPADRAIWILRQLGHSGDNELAIAALEHLVQVEDRPALVKTAEAELAERSVVACEAHLSPLGAKISWQEEPIDTIHTAVVVEVQLGPEWRGTIDDLNKVARLPHQAHFRLEGEAIDDRVIELFEEKPKLAVLQLHHTSVTPAAIDALKQRHPDAILYMRNAALLGVSADNHAAGVLVRTVQSGSAAAAAGIMPGDVITKINGHTLPDFDRLTVRIAQHEPGERIDVEILRGDERRQLDIVLGAWPDQS